MTVAEPDDGIGGRASNTTSYPPTVVLSVTAAKPTSVAGPPPTDTVAWSWTLPWQVSEPSAE